ncbi:glycosyltransferase [Prochlorococcus sp. MIT 0801]|uniref:glycosyltransferase n=1 Tax=Prochlorococcus sp. MIT 0801 TaxID=1501269 RepID=UPI0004F666C9|nr:glycosyltransferase [Prochlorococcus sp. MIT 0801]AIQ98265.1 putative glycosyltransferase [Prochlorococcus sp. MIT 0801]
MDILFIHQNFPAQFIHLAPALVREGLNITTLTNSQSVSKNIDGIRFFNYPIKRSSSKNIHPWLTDLETKTIRGEYCFRAAYELCQKGYKPNLIISHPAWGESLFLKEIWPDAKIAIYCEFFYRSLGADINFDPEFPITDPGDPCRVMMKNINNNLHLQIADVGISPTKWQKSTFPEYFQKKISVIHDGINTTLLRPNDSIEITLDSGLKLSKSNEIITFVNRNLEPYRGFHTFMRSLPKILKERPNLYVLIVGGDSTSYGTLPENGKTWKDIYANEVKEKLTDDQYKRVIFLGTLTYDKYMSVLQISTIHVYLTYPFVLSWSLLEAMSIGCPVIVSNTEPLHEIIKDHENGVYVDFFDFEDLSKQILSILNNFKLRSKLSENARKFIVKTYDLKTICLPKQISWVKSLL